METELADRKAASVGAASWRAAAAAAAAAGAAAGRDGVRSARACPCVTVLGGNSCRPIDTIYLIIVEHI